MWSDGCADYLENHFTVYMYQIITLYTLNIWSYVCQFVLNKSQKMQRYKIWKKRYWDIEIKERSFQKKKIEKNLTLYHWVSSQNISAFPELATLGFLKVLALLSWQEDKLHHTMQVEVYDSSLIQTKSPLGNPTQSHCRDRKCMQDGIGKY